MELLTKHFISAGSDGYLLDAGANPHLRTNAQSFLAIQVVNAATQPSDILDGYVWEAVGLLDSGSGLAADHSHWFILPDETGATTHDVNSRARYFDITHCSRVRVHITSNLSYGTVEFEAWVKGGEGIRKPSTPEPANLLFNLPMSSGGIANLPTSLLINGVTVAPSLMYRGQDATAAEWPSYNGVGPTLPIVNAGTDVTAGMGSPVGDAAVLFNSADYFQASSGSSGQLTNEDLVMEVVWKSSAASSRLIGTGNATSGSIGQGWGFIPTSTSPRFHIHDGTDFVVLTGDAIASGAWYHAMVFFDRSGSGQIYVNGAASGAPASLTAVGSLSGPFKLTVGNAADGSSPSDSTLLYWAVWARDNWLDTHLQATVAKERAARFFGVYPTYAAGTPLPSVMTRASTAYLDAYQSSSTRSLYQVGANWARLCSRKDVTGTTVPGFLGEPASTNLCLQSQAFNTAPWVKTNAGDIITDGYTAPDLSATADGLVANTTNTTHGVSQQITLSAAVHIFSVWAKQGQMDWLYVSNNKVSDCDGYFNLRTVQTGTKGAGASTIGIEDYGSGWRRCHMTFTGTAAAHTFVIQAAETDNDSTFSGNNFTPSVYLWGAQVEAINRANAPTTYVPTTTATATRAADALRFVGSANVNPSRGSAVATVLIDDHTTDSFQHIVTFGTDSANDIELLLHSGGVARFDVIIASAGQVNITGSTDVSDNRRTTLAINWDTNDCRLYVDGAQEGSTDTSCAMLSATPTIWIGDSAGASAAAHCLVTDLRIYRKPGTKT